MKPQQQIYNKLNDTQKAFLECLKGFVETNLFEHGKVVGVDLYNYTDRGEDMCISLYDDEISKEGLKKYLENFSPDENAQQWWYNENYRDRMGNNIANAIIDYENWRDEYYDLIEENRPAKDKQYPAVFLLEIRDKDDYVIRRAIYSSIYAVCDAVRCSVYRKNISDKEWKEVESHIMSISEYDHGWKEHETEKYCFAVAPYTINESL